MGPGKDVLERARQLRLAGLAHNSAGRPHRAARSLRAALALLPPLDAPADRDTDVVRVACLLTLAMSALATDGFEEATARLEEARVLAGNDPELVARYRCQRGNVLGRTGHFAAAIGELDVVMSEPVWFTTQERAATLMNRGMVNFELGRPDQAEPDFAAAAALARESGDPRYEFMAEHNRGYAKYLSGDLPGALAAMAAAELSPADVFRGPSLYDLARVLQEVGLLDESLEVLDRAQAACRPREHRMLRAEIDLERARILRLTGDFDEARAAARAARTRFVGLGAKGLAAQAELVVLDCELSRRRRLDRVLSGALASEQVAAELGDAELRARSIIVAAESAVLLGRPEDARSALHRYPSDAFGLVVGLRHDYAEAVTDIASGRSPRRRLSAAAAALAGSQSTSASLESRAARKVLSLRLTELDLDLAVGRGPLDVLSALDRWSSLGLPVVQPPADERQLELVRRLRALSQAIRDEPTAVEAAQRRAESASLQRELSALGLAQSQQATAAAAAPGLGEALESITAAGRDLLWLFPHDGGLWGVGVIGGRRRLARLSDLDRCLEATRRLQADLRAVAYQPTGPLRDAIGSSLTSGLAWLDTTVVRPWRLRSPGLVVIGTHAVSSVPWGRLPSLAGSPVTVARSATEWVARRTTSPTASVAVLTGPGLRHAETEAARVATAWPGARLISHARAADLVSALAGSDVVHVAAHGQHQSASPLFSSLRMADGDVYAHELPAGAIRARHVVLSACDVGTAHVRPGDEPLGLAHTLLATGVSSVVAAVAPVPDDETEAVMASYHQRLAAGLRTDEALADAGAGSAFVVLGSSWSAAPLPQAAPE
ncbi:MAG TPA: CHAT domain-containing protein [Propionicimonas sp.]|uniref:CHAT domain-containing protein n=1 Tax=Propionicimonas sp. TaxID=1955623 RepID=UPI002F3E631F